MISKIDINRIAEAVDIVDLVGAEVKLKPQGKTLVGCQKMGDIVAANL
jgi:DNA primase